MTVVQTVLVFIGIPLAIIVVITLAVYARTLANPPSRYRPGKPWHYPASWYVPHPEIAGSGTRAHGDATTAVGGASGEW